MKFAFEPHDVRRYAGEYGNPYRILVETGQGVFAAGFATVPQVLAKRRSRIRSRGIAS